MTTKTNQTIATDYTEEVLGFENAEVIGTVLDEQGWSELVLVQSSEYPKGGAYPSHQRIAILVVGGTGEVAEEVDENTYREIAKTATRAGWPNYC